MLYSREKRHFGRSSASPKPEAPTRDLPCYCTFRRSQLHVTKSLFVAASEAEVLRTVLLACDWRKPRQCRSTVFRSVLIYRKKETHTHSSVDAASFVASFVFTGQSSSSPDSSAAARRSRTSDIIIMIIIIIMKHLRTDSFLLYVLNNLRWHLLLSESLWNQNADSWSAECFPLSKHIVHSTRRDVQCNSVNPRKSKKVFIEIDLPPLSPLFSCFCFFFCCCTRRGYKVCNVKCLRRLERLRFLLPIAGGSGVRFGGLLKFFWRVDALENEVSNVSTCHSSVLQHMSSKQPEFSRVVRRPRPLPPGWTHSGRSDVTSCEVWGGRQSLNGAKFWLREWIFTDWIGPVVSSFSSCCAVYWGTTVWLTAGIYCSLFGKRMVQITVRAFFLFLFLFFCPVWNWYFCVELIWYVASLSWQSPHQPQALCWTLSPRSVFSFHW